MDKSKNDYGIKVQPQQDTVLSPKAPETAHILLSFAVPYLMGAELQVQRYQEATVICKQNAVLGVQRCIHEVSCLFEDLATIAKYLERVGESHQKHQLWYDVRHLIRHDIREEFDADEPRKKKRAKRLGMGDKLQMSLGFKDSSISVGSTSINVSDISDYISWANSKISTILNEAEKKGYIKRS